MHIYTWKMSQWSSCVWARQPMRWMNRVTSTDTYHTTSQTDFSCLLSASVYSHYFIDSAPSSGQQHNKRNHFPLLNMILSMGSWEMEKKIHITLAGQRDLSCASAEFPYLDFSVTKACSICGKSWKNNYWYFLFSLPVSSCGEGGREEGRCKEGKTTDQLCCIFSLLLLGTILLLLSFVQKNIAALKKEMSRDPIFRNSRLAKMGSDNVILAIASRARAQKGQCFLSFIK